MHRVQTICINDAPFQNDHQFLQVKLMYIIFLVTILISFN